MPIKIDYKKCCWKGGKSCSSCSACTATTRGCVEACPVQALKREKLLVFDASKCISCGACVVSCKHGALTLE